MFSFGETLYDDVPVSFCLTPADISALRTFVIISEFIVDAAFAVLATVCTPKPTVTLSGTILVVAVPVTANVWTLLVLTKQRSKYCSRIS